jgi:hypothetical protein
MSPTLCSTISYTRAYIPVFQHLNQSLLPSRAVYSTCTTARSESSFKQQLTVYLGQQNLYQKPKSRTLHHNMSFLLPGLRRGLMLSTPLVLSAPLLVHQYRYRQPILCDGPDPLTKITGDLTRNYASEAKTPIITESGAANPRAIRQVSMGSILGVFCGLGISVFSKPLAILIGLGIFVLQVSKRSHVVERRNSVKLWFVLWSIRDSILDVHPRCAMKK